MQKIFTQSRKKGSSGLEEINVYVYHGYCITLIIVCVLVFLYKVKNRILPSISLKGIKSTYIVCT